MVDGKRGNLTMKERLPVLDVTVLIESKVKRTVFKGVSQTGTSIWTFSVVILNDFGQIICNQIFLWNPTTYMPGFIKYNPAFQFYKNPL